MTRPLQTLAMIMIASATCGAAAFMCHEQIRPSWIDHRRLCMSIAALLVVYIPNTVIRIYHCEEQSRPNRDPYGDVQCWHPTSMNRYGGGHGG